MLSLYLSTLLSLQSHYYRLQSDKQQLLLLEEHHDYGGTFYDPREVRSFQPHRPIREFGPLVILMASQIYCHFLRRRSIANLLEAVM